MSRRADAKAVVCLLLGVFLFSGLSRVNTSFDSRWTVYIAMSLWRHGTTNLDDYRPRLRTEGYYAVECVSPEGTVLRGVNESCRGHYYNSFPVGGPVLTAPLVLALIGTLKATAPLFAHLHPANPVIAGFLQGDFDAGHALIEQEVASFLLAIAAVLIYFTARMFLSVRRAVLLSILFATATPAYSVAGRALWQHTPSMLLLSAIILMLLQAEKRPNLAGWAGIPVALSYTVRPTDALFVVIFTAYVAVRHREQLLRYLLFAAPIAAAFLAYNFSVYHALLSPYYRSPLDGFYPANWSRLAEALAGNLVSPSRGLFLYTPVFLFSIWSMVRCMWQTALSGWLRALAAIHWIAVSSYVVCWWAGACYGPRFFTDLTPVCVLFLIPFLAQWERLNRYTRGAFLGLAFLGLVLHLLGGWSQAVYEWNSSPMSIDAHPERNWDWRDPPFLRGV
jgi:hypothetical protein